MASCLLDDGSCSGQIVRAHTVPNAAALDCISRDGHVYMIEQDPSQPGSRFTLVGRNKATTFTGFCNRHDTGTFLEIDAHWDPGNYDRMVVLHDLRAAAREYWAKLNAIKSFTQVLSYYMAGDLRSVASHFGLNEDEVSADPNLIAFWRAAVASYRSGAKRMAARFASLQSQIERRDYHLTISKLYVFKCEPKVGAAIWTSPEYDFRDQLLVPPRSIGHLPDMAVCILPEPAQVRVVLAYHRNDRRVLDTLPAQLDQMTVDEQRIALSWYVVMQGENVAYSPRFVDSLGPAARAQIEQVFFETIHGKALFRGLPKLDFFD